jgi:hypothetical protein
MALEAIAKACQIPKFVGDACNDSQVWTFDNIPFHEAARRISERGHISDMSCMQLGLDLDGTLFYKNVSQMGTPTTLLVYPGGSKQGHPIVSYKPRSLAGSKNQQSGYRKTRIEQDLFNSDIWKTHKTVAFQKNEPGSLQVDNTVRNKLVQSRVEYAPIDVGNVHETYEQALYQNRRISSLFNVGLDVLAMAPTTVRLFDTVSMLFNINSPEVATNIKQYNGEFLVSSRVVCLQGQEVTEKLELTRRTLNVDIPSAATGDS